MGDTRSDDAATTALALAAGAGDRVALASFVRATQRDVYRFLTHLCDQGAAEDLAQETYLRALRALPRFAGRSSARTWLLAIARRVAADHVRGIVRQPRTTSLPTARDDSRETRRPGFADGVVLRELVGALEPERREAFVLTQVLDLSYAAAAEICRCPIGTIRSRVARAREDLVCALNAPDLPDGRAAGP